MNGVKKRIITGVMVTTITLCPVAHSTFVYANPPSFSQVIKKVVKNKVKDMQKENEKYRQKNAQEVKEREIKKTSEVLKERLGSMDQKQIEGLKVLLDDLTGKEGKSYDDVKKQKLSIHGRIKSKNLDFEGHRTVRKYCNNLPKIDKSMPLNDLEDFIKGWIVYINDPHSDLNYQRANVNFFPAPTMQVPNVTPIPLTNPLPILP